MSAASGALQAVPAAASRTGLDPARALARRAFRDGRVRTVSFACLFAVIAYIQPAAYRHAYPTAASRLAFAHSFANNKAIRLFYGAPHDLLSVGGYTAWRVGGTLAIFAAVFGLLAAVRALRAEEDTGRMELVLAGALGRRTAYLSALAAIAVGVLALGLAEFAGLLLGSLPAGASAYLAVSTASVMAVFVGVGAVVSQLAPTRRMALELGGAAAALCLLLRVIADTSNGADWLRWATPLGWAEEMRPFTGAHPLVLALPAAASLLLLASAARIAANRDIGTGLLPARDAAEPRLHLLSSPTAQALRSERGSLIVWLSSVGAFAYIIGVIARSTSSAGISKSLQRELAKLGSGSIVTPSGYLAFVFIFFVLAVSLFACAQIGATRAEEAEQRLETLLSLPVGRRSWLGGRLLLATCAADRDLDGGRPVQLGGRRVGGCRPLATADARGGRELPSRRASVSRDRRARVCARAPRKRGDRIRAGRDRVPLGSVRLSARRAEVARRTDAVRARGPRAGAAVPGDGCAHHACARGRRLARRGVGIARARPGGGIA